MCYRLADCHITATWYQCSLLVYLYFRRNQITEDNTDVSDIEHNQSETLTKEKIKSLHERKSFTLFKLHDCSRKTFTNLILHTSSHSENAANSAPWHVDKNCCVIVDLNKMKDREDLCTDAWRWKLWNTYPTLSPSFEGPYHEGNNPSEYRVVRRTCKYLTHEKIEKQTYLTHPSDVLAISRYQHITKHAGQYSLVLYRFKEKSENLPLKTDDPLKQLIEKYHEDTKNGQKVIQTFQPNEFPYFHTKSES